MTPRRSLPEPARVQPCNRAPSLAELPLPTDQVELITLALIYKFLDDLDEESVQMGGKRSFFTGPLADYRRRALLHQTVTADERMNRFARGLELLGGADGFGACAAPRFEAKIRRVLERVWGNGDVVLTSKEEECQSPAPA